MFTPCCQLRRQPLQGCRIRTGFVIDTDNKFVLKINARRDIDNQWNSAKLVELAESKIGNFRFPVSCDKGYAVNCQVPRVEDNTSTANVVLVVKSFASEALCVGRLTSCVLCNATEQAVAETRKETTPSMAQAKPTTLQCSTASCASTVACASMVMETKYQWRTSTLQTSKTQRAANANMDSTSEWQGDRLLRTAHY